MLNALTIALAVILIITSVLLIVLILLHRGKGGGLSDLFGGGVSSSVGGKEPGPVDSWVGTDPGRIDRCRRAPCAHRFIATFELNCNQIS